MPGARAQVDATYIGAAADWSDPAQWDTNPLYPDNGNGGNDYNVFITNGGTAGLDLDITIEDLTLLGSIGVSSGPADLDINGTFTWDNGGSLSGQGTTAVIGTLDILAGANDAVITTSRMLDLTGGGAIARRVLVQSGAGLHNATGSVIDLSADVSSSTGGVFTNDGIVNFNSPVNRDITGPFTNDGQLNVVTGNLDLNTTGVHAGSFTVATGTALLVFASDPAGNVFGATGNVGGAGDLTLASGIVEINGGFDFAGELEIAPGTTVTFNSQPTSLGSRVIVRSHNPVTFAAGLPTLGDVELRPVETSGLAVSGDTTVTGTLAWTSGRLTGAGKTTVAGAITNGLGGSFDRIMDGRDLEIAASGSMTDVTLKLANGAGFTNFGLVTDSFVQNGTGGGTFTNAGTFTVTGGINTLVPPFTNDGTVAASGATAVININTGGTHEGTFSTVAGSVISFNGSSASTHTLTADSRISGAGRLTFSKGTANLNGTWEDSVSLVVDGGGTTVNFLAGLPAVNDVALSGGSTFTGAPRLELIGDTAINGATTWGGRGIIASTGTITAAGPLAISGTPELASGTFVANGDVTASASLLIAAGAVFENASGDTLSLEAGGAGFAGAGTLRNTGRIVQGGGFQQHFIRTLFEDTGTTDVTQILNVLGNSTHAGDTTVAPGATLNLGIDAGAGTTHEFSPGASLTVGGTLDVTGEPGFFGSATSSATLGGVNDFSAAGATLRAGNRGTANVTGPLVNDAIDRIVIDGGTVSLVSAAGPAANPAPAATGGPGVLGITTVNQNGGLFTLDDASNFLASINIAAYVLTGGRVQLSLGETTWVIEDLNVGGFGPGPARLENIRAIVRDGRLDAFSATELDDSALTFTDSAAFGDGAEILDAPGATANAVDFTGGPGTPVRVTIDQRFVDDPFVPPMRIDPPTVYLEAEVTQKPVPGATGTAAVMHGGPVEFQGLNTWDGVDARFTNDVTLGPGGDTTLSDSNLVMETDLTVLDDTRITTVDTEVDVGGDFQLGEEGGPKTFFDAENGVWIVRGQLTLNDAVVTGDAGSALTLEGPVSSKNSTVEIFQLDLAQAAIDDMNWRDDSTESVDLTVRSELNIDTDGSIEAPNMSVNLIAPDGGFADIKLGSGKVFSLNTKELLLDGSLGTARVRSEGGTAELEADTVRATGSVNTANTNVEIFQLDLAQAAIDDMNWRDDSTESVDLTVRSELNIDTDGSIEAPNMSVNLIAPDGGFADIKLGSGKVFSLNTKDVLLDGSAGTARVGTDGGRAQLGVDHLRAVGSVEMFGVDSATGTLSMEEGTLSGPPELSFFDFSPEPNSLTTRALVIDTAGRFDGPMTTFTVTPGTGPSASVTLAPEKTFTIDAAKFVLDGTEAPVTVKTEGTSQLQAGLTAPLQAASAALPGTLIVSNLVIDGQVSLADLALAVDTVTFASSGPIETALSATGAVGLTVHQGADFVLGGRRTAPVVGGPGLAVTLDGALMVTVLGEPSDLIGQTLSLIEAASIGGAFIDGLDPATAFTTSDGSLYFNLVLTGMPSPLTAGGALLAPAITGQALLATNFAAVPVPPMFGAWAGCLVLVLARRRRAQRGQFRNASKTSDLIQ